MWLVCIDIEFVRRSEGTVKQKIVLATAPLVPGPADRRQKPKLGKFRQYDVLCPLAVELA